MRVYSLLTRYPPQGFGLNCLLYLAHDGLSGPRWIAGLSNGPTNYQMTGASPDGLTRGSDSLLVVPGASLRTNSRNYDAIALSQQLAKLRNFVGRSHHTTAPGTLGQCGHPECLIENTPGDAGLLEVFIIQAGQNRYSQQQQA